MEEFIISDLIKGKPNKNLSEKAKICFEKLEELNIEFEYVEYNKPPQSEEELKLVDKAIQVKGIKNLIFKTKKAKEIFFIIIPREDRLDSKLFRQKHGVSQISMANESELSEILNTHSGAVGIMELIEDTEGKVKIFIDEKILNEEYFRFHPNDNVGTVRVKMEDFKDKIIPYIKHDLNIL